MIKLMKTVLIILIITSLFSCSKASEIINIDLIPVKIGENYEYVNIKGEIVINPQFSEASIFRNGIALVKTSGENSKWGFIDTDGKFIINPIYKSATVFSEDLAWVVSENGAPSAINKKGEVKFILKDAEDVRIFKNGLAAFSKVDSTQNKWGFVNKDGKVVINTQFNEASNFNESKCAIKNKDNKWGFIDEDGKIIINCQFDSAYDFENKTAVVYLKDKAGVIDENGKFIINPQYSNMQQDGDMYLFMQDDKYGWCDSKGKIIINPQFESATRFNGSKLAAIKIDKQYGYIDKKGKIVVNPQFNYAAPFNNDIALVQSSDKTGFIDTDGKFVINPQFDEFSYDYLSYVIRGATFFGSVTTDYFDITKIVEKLNFDSPEGLLFTNNFSQIIKKFKVSENDLNQYDDNLKIFADRQISNDTKYSFEVMGKPFEYNSNYDKVFMSNKKPEGFLFKINLTGRAAGKTKNIVDVLKTKLKGYELVKEGFFEKNPTAVYKNKNKQIVVTRDDNNFFLYILKSDYNISGYISRIVSNNEETSSSNENGYETAVDTTAVDSSAATYEGYQN